MGLAGQVELTEELGAVLKSQTLIDQTLGMIMSQRLCDADAAMTILCADALELEIEPLVRATQILSAVSAPRAATSVQPRTGGHCACFRLDSSAHRARERWPELACAW